MPGYEDRASTLQGAGDTIFKLVCEGSTPEQWAEWLRAPLEHAAGTANHDLVKKLLKAGADGRAGWKGCHGKTLMHAAAEGGDGQVITALIRAGAGVDMNTRIPGTGRTPLHVAILSGKEAAAGALVLARANANIFDANGDAPLHLAIEGGQAGVAKDLLIGGADHAVRGSKGQYPIHLAAARGHDEIVLSLVRRGANLDLSYGQKNKTPLAVAVLEGRVSTVEVLLAEGADANIKMGLQDDTVLHIAAKKNKTASIPALAEAGAHIEAKGFAESTPLHYAAVHGSWAAMLALLQLGANVNSRNNNGRTPLHSACFLGNPDAADLLLRWGADETIVSNEGRTPSQRIPDIDQDSEQRRPTLERLTTLLAHAPQDRAWRRRGLVVLCRAHPDRLRLAVNIPDYTTEAIGQQPRQRSSRRARRGQRSSRRARRGQANVEVGVGGAHGGGAGSGNVRRSERRAGIEGAGRALDGVAAWVVAVNDEDLFRNVVRFL